MASTGEKTKAYWAQWETLAVHNGVLYRLWETPTGDHSIKQLILPKVLQRSFSNSTAPQRLGIWESTRPQELFVRGSIGSSALRTSVHSARTVICACPREVRGPMRKRKTPLGKYNVGAPMEQLAIDVLDSLPTTEAGNKYLLIPVNYLTKWVEAYPLPNQEAVTVAEALVKNFVCLFGVPLIIHSDQGRNFECLVFSEMCQLLGIHKTKTTPLHPQSDGMLERFNCTVEDQLSKFVDENQRDWNNHAPLLLMAYRTAVHETTGCTPHDGTGSEITIRSADWPP